jgi:hypothetical protein
MTTLTVFDLETGDFSRSLSIPKSADPLAQIRAGEGFKLGRFDKRSQRVDLTTGDVVDYQPPSPGAGYEWNVTSKRWVKRADVIAREARQAQAAQRIDELELSQRRPVRELLIDPNNAAARTRLVEIEAEIATQRERL